MRIGDVVDLLSCCILTWDAFTTLLPAFLLAGAVVAFVPQGMVVKWLGAQAKKTVAYGVALLSGLVLEVCACNVVPLFLGIYKRGAGLGPAIAFLYGAPAINILSMAFVFRVIGWRIGVWRIVFVLAMTLSVALLIALIFRREAREQSVTSPAPAAAGNPTSAPSRTVWLMLAGLTVLVIVGASNMSFEIRAGILGAGFALTFLMVARRFGVSEFKEWMFQSYGLAKMVVPILVPAVFVIGLVGKWIPIKPFYDLFGQDSIQATLAASVFGTLMYFPILSEVAFVKTLLTLGMKTGSAMSMLLTAPGLSLPTILIIRGAVGGKKLVAYVALVIVMATLGGYLFGRIIGTYTCPCMLPGIVK